ncbi:hypothetical protein [Nostoc sp.]|uniref:hypothetical protein n=1 Tax=Nostoc sp. TaxID=1180 RepID=UPI002FF7AB3A
MEVAKSSRKYATPGCRCVLSFFYQRFQLLSMPKISKFPLIKLVDLPRERIYFISTLKATTINDLQKVSFLLNIRDLLLDNYDKA